MKPLKEEFTKEELMMIHWIFVNGMDALCTSMMMHIRKQDIKTAGRFRVHLEKIIKQTGGQLLDKPQHAW